MYIWILFDTLPRLLIVRLRSWVPERFHKMVFVVLLLIIYPLLVCFIKGWSLAHAAVGWGMSAIMNTYFFTAEFGREEISTEQSIETRLPFLVPFCLLFSVFLFGDIPQHFAGGKPARVKVYPVDERVFISQFSRRSPDRDGLIEAELLYESDQDYYFIQAVGLSDSAVIFNYRVKKVSKDMIKKIEFIKPNWITFKKEMP